MLPVAVARSCCYRTVMRYVLPVLWMTSLLHKLRMLDVTARLRE